MALTKTNTDSLCPPTKGGNPIILWLQKMKYRYYLWTGLYMLETHERLAFHVVVLPIAVAFCLYAAVFVRGFFSGWGDVLSVWTSFAGVGRWNDRTQQQHATFFIIIYVITLASWRGVWGRTVYLAMYFYRSYIMRILVATCWYFLSKQSSESINLLQCDMMLLSGAKKRQLNRQPLLCITHHGGYIASINHSDDGDNKGLITLGRAFVKHHDYYSRNHLFYRKCDFIIIVDTRETNYHWPERHLFISAASSDAFAAISVSASSNSSCGLKDSKKLCCCICISQARLSLASISSLDRWYICTSRCHGTLWLAPQSTPTNAVIVCTCYGRGLTQHQTFQSLWPIISPCLI